MVILAVLLSKDLHDSVYLLAFSWKSEASKHLLHRVNERLVLELKLCHIVIQHFLLKLIFISKIVTYGSLVQSGSRLQEVHYVQDVLFYWLLHNDSLVYQELNSILGFEIEFYSSL